MYRCKTYNRAASRWYYRCARLYGHFDFSPIQYPADSIGAEWRTTHFDFHSIHDNLLKLDILGHDDPTVIRMLQDLSGIDPKQSQRTIQK